MGATSAARSTCCPQRPPGSRARPTLRQICRGKRWRRQKANGQWRETRDETVDLNASLTAAVSPHALLCVNRGHWGIEIMPGNKDVILGKDADTSRCANAPHNIFSLTGFMVKILDSVSPSPTSAIEPFQDARNRALRLVSDFH
ncbi:MAG: hypothetical protein ACREC9_01955 [Methylocella sp.]